MRVEHLSFSCSPNDSATLSMILLDGDTGTPTLFPPNRSPKLGFV